MIYFNTYSVIRMVVERENSLNLSIFFTFMRRLLIWRSCGGVFRRAGEFLPVTPSHRCESLPSRHCEERSDEAISLLHIPIGVRRSGEISLLTTFARNDEKVACNGNFSQVNKERN